MRNLACWTGVALLVGTVGCFDPEDPPGDTDSPTTTDGPTSSTAPTVGTTATGTGSTSTATMTTGPTSTTGVETDSTPGSDASSTGEQTPDWGEGEPPDFGDLGAAGDGNVLAMHVLSIEEAVDVWVVGDTQPLATGLERGEAVVLPPIGRDPHRIVFARTGTTEAVACSDWFPLRAEEQWAVIGARGEHTCPSPASDGGTITFEQELALTGNTVRYVHAAAPDDFTVLESETPQAGTLAPLGTLATSDLPDCSSGCTVDYSLEAAGQSRYFTFTTAEVSDVPPAGEVMFVAVGDVRQDWPNEGDALELLAVDVEGTTRRFARDPEVTVVAPLATQDVVFRFVAAPTSIEFATVSVCNFGACELPTQRFNPSTLQFSATEAGQPSVSAGFTLEAGRRYVMMTYAAELVLLADEFDRTDQRIAVGRAYNTEPTSTLNLGRVFNGMPQPFAGFTSVPPNTLSVAEDLPVGSWSLLASLDAAPLSVDCFFGVATEAGWRGLLSGSGLSSPAFLVALDAWPPSQVRLNGVCS